MQDQPERPSSFAMAFKPFRDMFVFSGRSRRTEAGAFLLLGTFANAVTIQFPDSGTAVEIIRAGWSLLWGFPWIALMVRRLHDQGRSGRWAWALTTVFAALLASAPFLPQSATSSYHVTMFGWTYHPVGPLAILHGILLALSVLALLAICLAPEESGTNRYGADPRLNPDNMDPATG